MSRSHFGNGRHDVVLPPEVTVYYTTFTYLPNLTAKDRDLVHPFFVLARNNFGIAENEQEPLLADGHMVLAYDAAAALAEAARRVFETLGLPRHAASRIHGSRSVTSGGVLQQLPALKMPQGASGTVDFTRDDNNVNGVGNRGLTLVNVTVEHGTPRYRPVCGRLNGGDGIRALTPC